MTPVAPRRQTLVAVAQFAITVLCLPALILPESLPRWSVTASLVGLGLVPLLGLIAIRRPFARTPVDLPLGLTLLLALTTLLIAQDRAGALPHVYKVIAGTACFYAVVGLLQQTQWFNLCAWGLCLLGIALVPALLFGTQWGGMKFSWMPWKPSDVIPYLFRPFWKPEGYQGFNANLSGALLAIVLPFPVAYALIGAGRRPTWHHNAIRIVAGLESLLIAALLLLTQSRGSILGALVALGTMLAARNWRWMVVVALVLTGGLFAFRSTAMSFFGGLDLQSDVDSALNSAEGRIELWYRGWSLAQDFPFTGIGMNMVADVMPLRYPTFRIRPDAQIEHLHSIYANTAAEMGFPGLITLGSLLLTLLSLFWRAGRRARTSAWAPLILGALGTLMVVCVQGVTDTLFHAPKAYLIVMAIFAIGVAVDLQHLYGDRGL